MTVAVRCGVHIATSRAQFIFTTFGTTASSGYASATFAAMRLCAVLPRPGSSASRNVRWPWATASMNSAWWCISGLPGGAQRGFACGSGSSMLVTDPPRSNARNSGPSSSQLESRRVRCGVVPSAKSGARNGFASWRARTETGSTWRSANGSAGPAIAGASSSGTS